jgi:hypothetical protein
VHIAPSPLVAPLPRRSEWKPSGIPSVTVVPTVILQSVPAFLLRTPGGGGQGCLRVSLPDIPERSARASPGGNLLEFPRPRSDDRGALVSSSFPSRLSLSGYLAHPIMFAKPKGIPVEARDFLGGKGYPSAQLPCCCRLSRTQRMAKKTKSVAKTNQTAPHNFIAGGSFSEGDR